MTSILLPDGRGKIIIDPGLLLSLTAASAKLQVGSEGRIANRPKTITKSLTFDKKQLRLAINITINLTQSIKMEIYQYTFHFPIINKLEKVDLN